MEELTRPSGPGRLTGRRLGRRFVAHYAEMVVAMLLGMATLYPAWSAVAEASASTWLTRVEVDSLMMATAMAVPMAGWMVLRGHGVPAAIEMSLAMYVGFVVFFPFLWSGLIDAAALLGLGHVAMLLLMALVMVRHAVATRD